MMLRVLHVCLSGQCWSHLFFSGFIRLVDDLNTLDHDLIGPIQFSENSGFEKAMFLPVSAVFTSRKNKQWEWYSQWSVYPAWVTHRISMAEHVSYQHLLYWTGWVVHGGDQSTALHNQKWVKGHEEHPIFSSIFLENRSKAWKTRWHLI